MDFQYFILNNFISFSVAGQIMALDYKLTVLKAACVNSDSANT